MSRLVEFLLARIAEDEAVALEVQTDLRDDVARGFYAKGREPDPSTDMRFRVVDGNAGEPTVGVGVARVLATCKAHRAIIELHQSWPVLLETEPTYETGDADDPNSMVFRMSKRIQWLTEQEYRTRFGDDPPTAPMLLELAKIYADHPDYAEAVQS